MIGTLDQTESNEIPRCETPPADDWLQAIDADPETRELEQRISLWTQILQPADELERWVASRAAVASFRIDRCVKIEMIERAGMRLRARHCWDDDRDSDAEALGESLSKNPSRTRKRLLATPHGCDWLLERWNGLLEALKARGDWNESQRALAFELLGIPVEIRTGAPGGTDSPEGFQALALREIERIQARRAKSQRLDRHERELASRGHGFERTAEARALRREEAASSKTLTWALKLLEFRSRERSASRARSILDSLRNGQSTEPDVSPPGTSPAPHPPQAHEPPLPARNPAPADLHDPFDDLDDRIGTESEPSWVAALSSVVPVSVSSSTSFTSIHKKPPANRKARRARLARARARRRS